ncbi:MAG: rod shape-determining protein [Bacteroidales bacterium]|nr:rod shape-determining protein [Bacteroidales bacterium]MCM1415235.1 rod shape-determining protein [bacterium]MCM1423771.1 rod shape-determining protein [bacterium]
MTEAKKFPGKIVFGLDIGTRSIVGTVGYRTGGKFHVVTQSIREHQTRAMLDGQIHDIYKVGETIKEVKAELEERIGRPLKDVCIAAAGRVLQTVNIRVDQELENEREITGEDIYALDSTGIERAYQEFLEKNDMDMKFYCVGYSVVRYYMNGYQIGNLEGHKAKTIGADLIATFLPEDVVDGLYKAVGVAGLDVVNLTLEPIAAIQVAIPEMYRMLNIALVDVGAGTSDISVTRDGSIIAYGMIPIAGDSLTEVVAKHCLVDFATAEQIKRETGVKDVIEYKDIMGLTQTITTEEVERVASDVIENMTSQVADKIKSLNGDKSVSAVFVVGGGGKLPGYTKALAEKLDIQSERVAVRGEEVMQGIEFLEADARKDSLMVTPIGICLSFYEQSNNFIFVYFNDQRVKIYDNNKAAVVDAAMQAEFASDGLFPKRGKELNFTVNGKLRIARGEPGEAAQITVNGNEADIYTLIHANDQIRVTESTAGAPAAMTLGELPEFGTKMWVEVNEKKVDLPKFASVNGELQSEYYEIQENDEIEILGYYTVRQISEFMDVVIDWNMNIYVNNKLADMETKVYENFSVIWTMEELALSDVEVYERAKEEEERVRENRPAGTAGFSAAASGKAGQQESAVSEDRTETDEDDASSKGDAPVSGETADTADTGNAAGEENARKGARIVMGPGVKRAEEEAKARAKAKEEEAARAKAEEEKRREELLNKHVPVSIIVTVNGEQIKLEGKKAYVFVDVFEYIDFDLSKPEGSGIVTNLNGRPAQYMENIKSGDTIEIYWKP